jgi:hypothetical protein
VKRQGKPAPRAVFEAYREAVKSENDWLSGAIGEGPAGERHKAIAENGHLLLDENAAMGAAVLADLDRKAEAEREIDAGAERARNGRTARIEAEDAVILREALRLREACRHYDIQGITDTLNGEPAGLWCDGKPIGTINKKTGKRTIGVDRVGGVLSGKRRRRK